MGILGWIVLGLLAGWLAKFFLRGPQPGGWVVTGVIGIVGAAIGGFIGSQLGWGGINDLSVGSLALSVVGSIVFLLILGAVRGK
jgi:uncharacterized membrane protein YeaQ/YmgE (transglycosylase-associated protein family)